MKKTTVLTGIAIMAVYGLSAQQLEKGNGLLNLGLGLSSYYTSGSGFTSSPSLEVSYESMLSDESKFSEKVSIGGFAGYYGAEYEYDDVTKDIYDGSTIMEIYYHIKYRYLYFGGVANYHFVNDDTFNVYAGARLGYVSVSTDIHEDSYPHSIGDDEALASAGAKSSGPFFAAQIGARYFLSEKIALNAELGYGLTALKLGVSFKL